MPNLKIDIIYYKTASDFEMEFNLSGCCRMRIFKEKLETKKEFVTSLSRDVSRSKVIIVVTDLFGDDSIIPTLSRAIGLPLTSPDNAEFGIKTEEEIQIPTSAVPLVTKSGIYGGCIIESGPQSIIIVSNVRSLRHEIMKAYVHNYVFDVGQLYAYQQRMGQNANIDLPQYRMQNPGSVATVDSVEQAPEETLSNADKPAEVAEENTDDLTAPVSSNEVADTANPEPTTSIDEIYGAHHKNAPGISEDCDFDITSELPIKTEDAPNKKKSGGRRATSIILLIIVILLLIAFGVLAYYFVYLPAIGVENNLVGAENGFFEGINAILNGR